MSIHEIGGTSILAAAVRQCLRASRPRRGAIALSFAAAGLQCAGIGTAVAAAADDQGLEEIVVTATRRDQSVQEIPFNISAMSGTVLTDANITTAVEALRMMPGVSVADRGYRNAGMGNSIVIRGINVDGGANGDVPLAAPSAVAIYIDNTALGTNFVLKDVERIEVLRGPQGTLYGSGSLAGNVRYIMNKPELNEFSGTASVDMGVTDGSGGYNLNPDLLLNIPAGDTLAFRLSGGLISNDGIIDYPNVYKQDADGPIPADYDVNGVPLLPDQDPIVYGAPVYKKKTDVDSVDIGYARASALWAPTDTFEAQLSYMWESDDTNGRRQVTPGVSQVTGKKYDEYEYGAVQVEPSSRDVQLTALEMELDLGFATLTSSTSYASTDGNGTSDNSGVYARNGWFRFYGSSPRPIAQAKRFYDDSSTTEELRLVSNGDQTIDWLGGIYWTHQDSSLGQNSYLVGYLQYWEADGCFSIYSDCSTNQDFLFRRKQQYDELAFYGEATWNFTDDLHFTLGGRFFDSSVDVDARLGLPVYNVDSAPPVETKASLDENDFLFRANFSWDVTDNSMLYATFSQGYRHGGANAVPTSGFFAENPALLTFKSDTVDNYEIGFKGTTSTLNYSVSLFYDDWKKPQINTATTNWGFFAVVNGDSATTQGIELELSGSINDELSYMLGYSYTDAELTSGFYQPAGNYLGKPPIYEDKVGKNGGTLPGAAENILSASLMYNTTLSHEVGFNAILSGYYQSSTLNSIGNNDCQIGYYTAENTVPANSWRIGNCKDSADPDSDNYAPDSVFTRYYDELDSFMIFNLSGTFTWEGWDASLYVKNIFNEDGSTGAAPFLVSGYNTDPRQNFYGSNQRNYLSLPRTFGLVIGYRF
jgi:outer membrane receptor protein involved in Fe transport